MATVSKLEVLIDDIEVYINSCKFQTLSNTRIIVNKDQIDELIRNLRVNIPEEVKRCERIVSQRDTILGQAQKQAEAMLKEASAQTLQLVNESEIMKKAYDTANEVVREATVQAQQIIDDATIQANDLKSYAVTYTDDLLASVQDIIDRTVEASVSGYNDIIGNLNNINSTVKSNRAELNPELPTENPEEVTFSSEEASEEDQA